METVNRRDLIYFPCPNTDVDIEKINKQRKIVHLDEKLKGFAKSWIKSLFYIFLLAVICAHNIVTEAFKQNDYLKGSIKNTFMVSE